MGTRVGNLRGGWSILSTISVMAALWAGESLPCSAGGGPENLFLLVNPTSRDSMTVANHYIDLRKIPPTNVFYLPWKKNVPDTTGSRFRDQILLPAIEEINRRKLGGQIDYLIYSCDFPWRLNFTKDFPGEKFQRGLSPRASLTGATYLWAFVKEKRKEMFNLNTNFYYALPQDGILMSRGFRARYQWAFGGKRAVKKGIPYLLSTMLGVTYGRGNTVNEILRYLQRAKEADGTKPKGTIYYVRNGSPRSTPRHDLFPLAVRELKLAGVQATILEGVFPKNKRDIMGVTTGAPNLDIAKSGCRFLPGAIGDNLTSAGGQLIIRNLKGRDQTPLTDFLRYGAAGACGTVVEPMSFPEKFPSPFLHVHYARGCSLAEAFYQSIAGPYQQLIVGDPLCQPWANRPEVTVQGIAGRTMLRGTIEMIPTAKVKKTQGIRVFELYVDGLRSQRCPPGGKFSLDTTVLADGSHELRVVAIDNTPIETQGRWIGEIMVKNGRDAVQLSAEKSGRPSEATYLTVEVASTTKAEIAVLHNGRELGRVLHGNGKVKIDLGLLGSGPVALQARTLEKPRLYSRPLHLQLP